MRGEKKERSRAAARTRLSRARLEAMVEEAIVDAYGDSEQAVGFFTMIEDNLQMPFETKLLGLSVIVERAETNDADDVVAVCRRGRERQRVPILDLPLPSSKPAGWEWIEAYRLWARGS
jgi:Calcium binding